MHTHERALSLAQIIHICTGTLALGELKGEVPRVSFIPLWSIN